MQKHLLYINLFTITSALALAACADEVDGVVTPDAPEVEVGEKTPIELSVGGVNSPATNTRAITKEAGNTVFTSGTSIFMLMKSEYEALPTDFAHLNYGGVQSAKYSTTCGKISTDGKTIVFENDDNTTRTRYWDDAHARNSHLSIWAVACDGLAELGGTGNSLTESSSFFNSADAKTLWSTSEIKATSLDWNVPHFSMTDKRGADATSMRDRDLLYSNNVSKYTISSTPTDNRTAYNTGTKKFGNSTLNFYHALSKITVRINMDQGFTGTNDFRFSATGTDGINKNVALQYFNIWGNFNIEKGEWSAVNNDHQAIAYMNNITGDEPNTTDTSKPTYELEALVIPYLSTDSKNPKGSFLNDDVTNKAIVFSIDNNKYEISRADLLTALKTKDDNGVASDATSVALEAGKHYVFTFTVSKTKISGLSAQILNWETVIADNINPSNARISLQLEDRGSAVTSNVDFYRATDPGNSAISDTYVGYSWSTGYSSGSGASYSEGKWTPTNWLWPNNATFYHFRAVGDKSTSSPAIPSVSSDAFTLTAGQTYKDYIWGAPFKELDGSSTAANNAKLTYSTSKGFDGTGAEASTPTHQIYHGIGPTDDPIKLLMFHMMSDVTIKVESVSGDAAVSLTDGENKTTIKFENIYTTGSVALGNGCVSTTDDPEASLPLTMSTTAENQWLYGAIPQDLAGKTTEDTDDVILVITTPDHNEYRVSMKDVKTSSITNTVTTNNIANPYKKVTENGVEKYVIDKWYPGFKYVYTFKLSKKKIEAITATVIDWENVTAGDDNVQIQ